MATDALVFKNFNCAVIKDDDAMVLFGYDMYEDEVRLETEGKLREVCREMADGIEDFFKIKIVDYGVLVTEDLYDLDQPANNTIYLVD